MKLALFAFVLFVLCTRCGEKSAEAAAPNGDCVCAPCACDKCPAGGCPKSKVFPGKPRHHRDDCCQARRGGPVRKWLRGKGPVRRFAARLRDRLKPRIKLFRGRCCR